MSIALMIGRPVVRRRKSVCHAVPPLSRTRPFDKSRPQQPPGTMPCPDPSLCAQGGPQLRCAQERFATRTAYWQERLDHDPAVQPPDAFSVRPTADRPDAPRPRDPGYLAALTAHQQTWDGRQETDPLIRAKAERQIRERIREPEHRFVEGRRAQTGRRAALDAADRSASNAARARALKRLAEERAAAARADRPAEPS
ncbi:hypothetical protein AB0J30_27240 [Streptomyces microflavus]|uniref:hypothetical protein n=1 Tax=Streptomyces microflavus TaxID=1919 RepID=UPI003420BC42